MHITHLSFLGNVFLLIFYELIWFYAYSFAVGSGVWQSRSKQSGLIYLYAGAACRSCCIWSYGRQVHMLTPTYASTQCTRVLCLGNSRQPRGHALISLNLSIYHSTHSIQMFSAHSTLHYSHHHIHQDFITLFSSMLSFFSLCVRYGRRFAMLLSLALQTVFGVAAAFAPNFPVYVTLRFIIGTTVSGVIINAFVLGEPWSNTIIFLHQQCQGHGFDLM